MNNKQMTQTLIKMAQRRAKAGSGSQVKIGCTKNMEFLQFIQTSFMLVGGHATALYMPERQTQDIDLLIHPENENKIHQEFLNQGGKLEGQLSIGGTSWNLNNNSLDIILCEGDWFYKAYQEAPEKWSVKVIPLPYLVLMKMTASRMQDLTDISRMLGLADDQEIIKVKKVIKKYTDPQTLEDIEGLIQLGKLEFP